MTDADHPPIRIGHAERDSARSALDAHLGAGRLDADEYADRFAAAGEARTRAELDELFVDLPQPHPFRPVEASVPARWSPPQGGYRAQPMDPVRRGSHDNPLGGQVAVTIARLTPLVALGLFGLTRYWEFFLLIPLVFALVYAGRREQDRDR
jgi:hypothetical protein